MTIADESEGAGPPVSQRENPFRGLDFYREEHTAWFFGRAVESRILIDHVRTARLTLLYAESGVGKSSLLRAGVAAGLARAARRSIRERGRPDFIPIVFSAWKSDPLSKLVETCRAAVTTYADLVEAARAAGVRALDDDAVANPAARPARGGLPAAVDAAATALGATMAIILDQFEDLFGYESHPETVAEQLAACVNDPTVRANVLIAVRQDAYGLVGDLLKRRVGNVYGNYFHLRYLTHDAAHEAITGPVEVYNARHPDDPVEIEEELAGVVLDEVRRANLELGSGRQEPDVTAPAGDEIEAPFLQLVMERLWEREAQERSRCLRAVTLQKDLGGVERIVREHFDHALSGLTTEQREIATRLFPHLVTPSGMKLAQTSFDLAQLAHAQEPTVATILETLDARRIVREADRAPGRGDRRYELFHDRLARPILDWGKAQETLRLAREADDRRREARRYRRLTWGIAGLAVLCLAALGGAVALWRYAVGQKEAAVRSATTAAAVALGSDAVAESAERPDVALLLALAAYRLRPNASSASAMTTSLEALRRTGAEKMLNGNLGSANSVAFSRDGRFVATGGGDGTVRLWEAATGRQVGAPLRSNPSLGVVSVTWSPNDRILASAGGFDPTVRLWDVATHQQVGVALHADRANGYAYGVAISHDGRLLASAAQYAGVRLWRLGTNATPLGLGTDATPLPFPSCRCGRITSIAFSPDDRRLAAAGYDGIVRVWSLGGPPRLLARTAGGHGAIYAVAFSRNGMLASAQTDGTVRLWDARSGAPLGTPLRGTLGTVTDVTFAPDGGTVASSGSDGNVRLWDVASHRAAGPSLRGHVGTVLSIAFSPDGHALASAGIDRTVRIWPVPAGRSFGAALPASDGPEYAVATSPDGTTVAAGGKAGSVRLWNARTGMLLATLARGGAAVRSVAFGRAGSLVAAAGDDGRVRLWTIGAGSAPDVLVPPHGSSARPKLTSVAFSPVGGMLVAGDDRGNVEVWSLPSDFERRFSTGQGAVESVAFSHDGTMLATGGTDHTIRLWEGRSLAPRERLTGAMGAVYAVAFSPDEKTVAASGSDQLIRLWSVPDGQQRRTIPGSNGAVYGLAFSPNGRILASAGADNDVRLWDPATGVMLGTPLALDSNWVNSVAFGASSDLLASASTDGTVRVWSGILWSGLSGLTQTVCGAVGTGLSTAQFTQYAPLVGEHENCPTAPDG